MGVYLGSRPLSVATAYRALDDPRSGGVVLFAGRVRPDRTARRPVRALQYEADRVMALEGLERLERFARARFGAREVVLWHRVGLLKVGTISVLVGVAAPHRAAAFAATRYLIDGLKRSVPIWKSEPARRVRRPPGRRSRRAGR